MTDYTPGRDLLNEIAASIKAADDVLQHSTDAALKAKAAVVKMEWEKARTFADRVTVHSYGYRQTLDAQVAYARGTNNLPAAHPAFTGVWPEPTGPRIFGCPHMDLCRRDIDAFIEYVCREPNSITALDHLNGVVVCDKCRSPQ